MEIVPEKTEFVPETVQKAWTPAVCECKKSITAAANDKNK
jgi:hypothetical protein